MYRLPKQGLPLDINEEFALYNFLEEYVPLFATNRTICEVKNKYREHLENRIAKDK